MESCFKEKKKGGKPMVKTKKREEKESKEKYSKENQSRMGSQPAQKAERLYGYYLFRH